MQQQPRLVMLVFSLVFFSAGLACADYTAQEQPEQARNIVTLSVEDGYKLINDNKGNPDFVIIDVRTPEEYAEAHIADAVNIDVKSPDFTTEVQKLDKTKTYVLYCRSGKRAARALVAMDDLEFMNVYNISGIMQWQEKGYPVTK